MHIFLPQEPKFSEWKKEYLERHVAEKEAGGQ